MPPPPRACGNCAFYFERDGHGECCANPPSVIEIVRCADVVVEVNRNPRVEAANLHVCHLYDRR